MSSCSKTIAKISAPFGFLEPLAQLSSNTIAVLEDVRKLRPRGGVVLGRKLRIVGRIDAGRKQRVEVRERSGEPERAATR
jgi:hypothetical protein